MNDALVAAAMAVCPADLDAIESLTRRTLEGGRHRARVPRPRRLGTAAYARFRERIESSDAVRAWSARLDQSPAHERDLLGELDSRTLAVGRAALLAAGFPPLRALDESWIRGWWTSDAGLLGRVHDAVAARCPATDDDVGAIARAYGWPREVRLRALLEAHQSWIARSDADGCWRPRPVLGQLRELITARSSPRAVAILLDRQHTTLAALAARHGVSRERIRQIERRALCEVDDALTAMPASIRDAAPWRDPRAPVTDDELALRRVILARSSAAPMLPHPVQLMDRCGDGAYGAA